MRVIVVVQAYSLLKVIMVIFAVSYFLGIFWLIYVRDFESQNSDIYDVYRGYYTFSNLPKHSFLNEEGEWVDNNEVLVKMWYYAITTLSTIGFGDFSPVSTYEKIIGAAILLFGVVVFSIIMNNLMEILRNFKAID